MLPPKRPSLLDRSGKVRDAKAQVLGVSRIPNDPVARERAQLEAFKSAVESVQRTIGFFESKLCSLNSAHESMLAQIEAYYGDENAGEFVEVETTFNTIPNVYHQTAPKLGAIHMRLSTVLVRIGEFEERLAERDRTYWLKQHYEGKIGNLSERDKLDSEKVGRNIQKRASAVTNFAEAEKVVREVREFLKTRFESIHSAVQMYARFLGDYHDSIAEGLDAGRDVLLELNNENSHQTHHNR